MRPEGLYCPAGGFYIDPHRKVERAVVTHGHSDHARGGWGSCLCSHASVPILKARLGARTPATGAAFGEQVAMGGATVSLHPAGHITGSAQVRVEVDGEVWVVTGDYKVEADAASEAFELVRCHTLVTETTFALPVYRWRPQAEVFASINRWWSACQSERRTAVLFGYSLGKAQRLMAGVDESLGPILVHPAVAEMNTACEEAGMRLPRWQRVGMNAKTDSRKALAIAPPGSAGSAWMTQFGESSTAYASGWMALSRGRTRLAADIGFVLSDHVDWPSLVQVVAATGAERVLTTHGYAEQAARYFREQGLDAQVLEGRPARPEPAEEGADDD